MAPPPPRTSASQASISTTGPAVWPASSSTALSATRWWATSTACRGTSPARLAGIRPADKIIAIGGTRVRSWTQLGTVIRAQPAGRKVPVVVQRGGRQLTLTATPVTVPGRRGSYFGIGNAAIFQRTGPLSDCGVADAEIG